MCRCLVCETCLMRTHLKHAVRREKEHYTRQLRVEHDPEQAKYVREMAKKCHSVLSMLEAQ